MNTKYEHLVLLYQTICHAYKREYGTLIACIEENYFQSMKFPSEYYLYADDFIYRMDVTELSYGSVLELAYKALVKEDYRQYLLGLKIVYAKLTGNQRYTYYDRDRILELAMEIWEHYELKPLQIDEVKIPELLLDRCNSYLPIGFEGMELKEYRLGSTRSFYDSYPTVPDKLFEKEYHSAIEQGNFYHHIIEIDHYINRENNIVTKSQWVHLAKLLSAHYATEKAPWSVDLTMDLLRVYVGLKDCCGQEDFRETLYQMVTVTLKIALKKIMSIQEQSSFKELSNVLNYMINVYVLESDNKFLEYIQELVKVMNPEDEKAEYSDIKAWLMEQKIKAG